MSYQLMELSYDELSDFLSAETLSFHHGKHHKGYVDKFNNLIKDDVDLQGYSLEELIKQSSGALFNNAAQIWNHNFFWNGLTNNYIAPPQEVVDLIDVKWGSLDTFKEDFIKIGMSTFGSGWVWLVKTIDGQLDIVSTTNANNPLTTEQVPLLVCDVWEHAYYIDFRNERKTYLTNFFNCVNWDFVKGNLLTVV